MNSYRKSVHGLDSVNFGKRLSIISTPLKDHNDGMSPKLQNGWNVLTNAKFYTYMLQGFFTYAAWMLPSSFLPSQMVSVGLSPRSGSKAVAILAASNFVGRLTSGPIMDHPKIGVIKAYITGHFFAGIVVLCFQFCTTEE